MSKKKQIVVSTPALHYDGVADCWRTRHEEYFCGHERLQCRFDIPVGAKRIWVEVSRTQWTDRSGLRCRIDLLPRTTLYRDEFGLEGLLRAPTRKLRRLLDMKPGKPETIYWRLIYEDKP